jgi:hypothetical protein
MSLTSFTQHSSRTSSSSIIEEYSQLFWNTKKLGAVQKNLPVGSITLIYTFQQGT